jgi:hypothetical protein
MRLLPPTIADLYTERRTGELFKDLQKAVGARTDLKPLPNVGKGSAKGAQIASLGVSKKQAENRQKLASVAGRFLF